MVNTCKNCGCPLDDKGKCIVCGTTTRINLSEEDCNILNEIPKDIIDAINSVPRIHPDKE